MQIALKPQLTRVNSKGEIVPVRPAQQGGGAQASGGGGVAGVAEATRTRPRERPTAAAGPTRRRARYPLGLRRLRRRGPKPAGDGPRLSRFTADGTPPRRPLPAADPRRRDSPAAAPPAPIAPGIAARQNPPADGAPAAGTRPPKLTKIGDFSEPVYIAQPRGERRDLFVVEKTGEIRVMKDGSTLPQPFLDITDKVSGASEQGLLSMAFAPDYARSGLFYVDYTDTAGDTRVVSYRRSAGDPLRADPGSARVVLAQDQPFDNHNGGQLQFGPGAPSMSASAMAARRATPTGPPRTARPCSARSSASTPPSPAPGHGSTPWGCATRGASPSTPATGRWRSAMSARIASRRWTTSAPPSGHELRLVRIRG